MTKLEKILLGFAGALLAGWGIYSTISYAKRDKSKDYIHGTVIEESGTIVDRQKVIERSEGALFGNGSVKFGDPTYAIKIKADDGNIYTLAVKESLFEKKLEALNLRIEEGTRVDIPIKAFTDKHGLIRKVGSTYASDVYITDRK